MCLCVGSFYHASTGLLDNKQCIIFGAVKSEYKELFFNVKFIENSISSDEKGIYTCGGGYSYLNLIPDIIEKHVVQEISILASKMFEIDIERKAW